MSAPTIEKLGPSTTVRKWRLDVNAGTTAVPVWVPVRGRSDFKPALDPTMQDDSDYDSEGYKSSTVTALEWGLEFKVLRKTQAGDALAYDEGQELLRLKANEMGPANSADVRWYEVTPGGPTVEAYRGNAAVTWTPEGGGMDGLDSVGVKLAGQGKRSSIVHPYAAAPTVPAITGLAPANGAAAGGALVSIGGASFDGATAVKFDATAATSFKVINDSLIVAVAPAHAAGLVDVEVTTPAGTSVSSVAGKFTYA